LELPLEIVQLGDRTVHRSGNTRDISSAGVCFLSPTDFAIGGRIEYVITLSGRNPAVRIRCLGKVVRSIQPQLAETPGFEVGITMDRYQFVRPDGHADDSDALHARA
jgi:PilZ domain